MKSTRANFIQVRNSAIKTFFAGSCMRAGGIVSESRSAKLF